MLRHCKRIYSMYRITVIKHIRRVGLYTGLYTVGWGYIQTERKKGGGRVGFTGARYGLQPFVGVLLERF